MITAKVFTEQAQVATKEFDDICDAEKYAMAILGNFTNHGTISLVQINDTLTGEQTEFEF